MALLNAFTAAASSSRIIIPANAYTFLYFKEQGLKRCQQTPFDIKERDNKDRGLNYCDQASLDIKERGLN
ncbi:hypothetical protein Tco_1444966 [Tanacetum coccineum]